MFKSKQNFSQIFHPVPVLRKQSLALVKLLTQSMGLPSNLMPSILGLMTLKQALSGIFTKKKNHTLFNCNTYERAYNKFFVLRIKAHFQVTLSGNTLTVVGDRLHDDSTGSQTLRRTFTRKYSIPYDVQLSSILSYMTDTGLLIIRVSYCGLRRCNKYSNICII